MTFDGHQSGKMPHPPPGAIRQYLATAEKAVSIVESGHRVFIGSACATPRRLVHALEQLDKPLHHVQLISFLTSGAVSLKDGEPVTRFHHRVFFVGTDVRPLLHSGMAEYVPVSLAQVPMLIEKGRIGIDVAFIQVSPPDEHGFCSLGVSVDITRRAVTEARVVVAEINPNMPRTHGNTSIPFSRIDRAIWVDEPVIEFRYPAADEIVSQIARHVARIIDNGSTLQIGFGQVPGEMLKYLTGRRDLGVHSDIITDEIVDLIESGVINGRKKTLHQGIVVASWCMGTERLYRMVDNNPMFAFHPVDYVCHPAALASNNRFVSVSQAHSVDLTGQICADQYRGEFHSGISTQADFMRGAAASPGGKPIICLRSTSADGNESRIKVGISPGEGVTIPRSEVHYVVTEYGSVYLFGTSVQQRALKLIEIAHPKFRDQLLEEAKNIGYVHRDVVIQCRGGYPVQEEAAVTLGNGTKILIRPARASDFVGMQDLYYHLSDDDRYTRFFTRLSSLSVSASEHLCSVDYEHEMALVAVVEGAMEDTLVGSCCYYVDQGTRLAEVAYMIHPEWQGCGLGKALQQRMVDYAKCRDIKGFVADILSSNNRMIGLFKCGADHVSVHRDEGTLEMTMLF